MSTDCAEAAPLTFSSLPHRPRPEPLSAEALRRLFDNALSAAQAAFGAQLKSVEQVDTIDTRATLAAVDSHLDQLRPAIKSYGGQVKVRLRA